MQAEPFALSCCFRTMSMSSSLCPSTGKADAKICQLTNTLQTSRRLFLINFFRKEAKDWKTRGYGSEIFLKGIRTTQATDGGKPGAGGRTRCDGAEGRHRKIPDTTPTPRRGNGTYSASRWRYLGEVRRLPHRGIGDKSARQRGIFLLKENRLRHLQLL